MLTILSLFAQELSDEALYRHITSSSHISISIGPHQIHKEQMMRVLQPTGKLTDSIINAYLGLVAADLAKPHLVPGFPPQFHILDNVVSSVLSLQPSILPFKPRLQLQKKRL
jgi:hypothetical protein